MPHDRILSTRSAFSAHDTTSAAGSEADACSDTPAAASAPADNIPWPNIPDALFDERAQWISDERARNALRAKAAAIRRDGWEAERDRYSPHYTRVIDGLNKAGVDYQPALAALLKLEAAPVTPIGMAAPGFDPAPLSLATLAPASASAQERAEPGDLNGDVDDVEPSAASDCELYDDEPSVEILAPPAAFAAGAAPFTPTPTPSGLASAAAEPRPARPPCGLPLELPELHNLRASGLTDAEILALGARTESDPAAINEIAGRTFTRTPIIDPCDRTKLLDVKLLPDKRHVVLVIPCPQPDGPVIERFRPRLAVPAWDKDKGGYARDSATGELKSAKYISPSGVSAPIFYPRGVLQSDRLTDPAALLVFCEGEKKAWLLQWVHDALSIPAVVIGLTGIDNAHDVARKDADGVYSLRPDLLAAVSGGTGRLDERRCVIAFDYYEHKDQARRDELDRLYREHPDASDGKIRSMCKRQPAREPVAAQRLADMLYEVGALKVRFCVPPTAATKQPKGVDDLYVAAALATRGLTVDQHDLDCDCAETLDHDAGRAAVSDMIDGAALLCHSKRAGEIGPDLPRFVFLPTECDANTSGDMTQAHSFADAAVGPNSLTAPKTMASRVEVSTSTQERGAQVDDSDDDFHSGKTPEARPIVHIKAGEAGRAFDKIEAILGSAGTVFVRGGRLVRPTAVDATSRLYRDAHLDNDETLGAETAADRGLRDMLPHTRSTLLTSGPLGAEVSRRMRIMTYDSSRQRWVPSLLPGHLKETLIEEGSWPNTPPLRCIVEVPAVASGGRVLEPGYDTREGVLFAPRSPAFAKLEIGTTVADSRAAVAALYQHVQQFPWTSALPHGGYVPVELNHDFAAWLSMVITIAMRPFLGGNVPIFAFDAPTARSGKTLLVQIGSLLGAGYLPARLDFAESQDAEFKKHLTAVAIESTRVLLIDNVRRGRVFQSDLLESIVTTGTWSNRVLGKNLSYHGEWTSVVAVTGNGLAIGDEMSGRVVMCSLDAGVADPGMRTGFTHKHILNATSDAQPALCTAVATIIRAWHVAGRPRALSGPRLGGFEVWDDGPRALVHWATGADPLGGRARCRRSDLRCVGRVADT